MTRIRNRILTILAAAGATFSVWTIADPLAGVDLVADTGSTRITVTPVAVVVTTLIAGLAGWGLLALLERVTTRAGRSPRAGRAAGIWTGIAVVVLLVSLLGPLGSAVGAGATVALLAMHLAAGAVLIPLLARSSVECRRLNFVGGVRDDAGMTTTRR